MPESVTLRWKEQRIGASKNTPAALREFVCRGSVSNNRGKSIRPVARIEPLAVYSPPGSGDRRPSLCFVQSRKTAPRLPPCQCKGRTRSIRGQRFSSSPPCVNRRGPSPWQPRGAHSSSVFWALLTTSSSVPASLSHDAPCSISTLTGGRFNFVPLPMRLETTFAPHGMVRSSRITPL